MLGIDANDETMFGFDLGRIDNAFLVLCDTEMVSFSYYLISFSHKLREANDVL